MKEGKIKIIDLATYTDKDRIELVRLIRGELSRRGLSYRVDLTTNRYNFQKEELIFIVEIFGENLDCVFNCTFMTPTYENDYEVKTFLKIAENMKDFPTFN